MTAIFSWTPSAATLNRKPRVISARFGGGYEQRMADGLNANLQQWDLTFNALRPDVALAIDNFLTARGAVESFLFTTKRNESILCLCREWTLTDTQGQSVTVSAKFEQVPA